MNVKSQNSGHPLGGLLILYAIAFILKIIFCGGVLITSIALWSFVGVESFVDSSFFNNKPLFKVLFETEMDLVKRDFLWLTLYLLMSIYFAYLFFTKKRMFPIAYTTYLFIYTMLIVCRCLPLSYEELNDSISQIVFFPLIQILYLHRSKRCKETFVN
jgi:hypothetical protein